MLFFGVGLQEVADRNTCMEAEQAVVADGYNSKYVFYSPCRQPSQNNPYQVKFTLYFKYFHCFTDIPMSHYDPDVVLLFTMRTKGTLL